MKDKDISSLEHTSWRCQYHIVFAPKYRRMVAYGRLKKDIDEIKAMVPEEWVMRILEEGGVTTDLRSVWLLVFWGRLTRGGMILTPMTRHHMMHLSPCLNNFPIIR